MKVVFLDNYGVLNSQRTPNPRKFPFIVDPALLTRLNRLLELTGAKVVLASNWRYVCMMMRMSRGGFPQQQTIGNARRIKATSSRVIRSRCR